MDQLESELSDFIIPKRHHEQATDRPVDNDLMTPDHSDEAEDDWSFAAVFVRERSQRQHSVKLWGLCIAISRAGV